MTRRDQALGSVALLLAIALLPSRGSAQPAKATYYDFDLYPTEHAPGAIARVSLRLAPSPFEIPVTVDGHVSYEIEVTAQGLPAAAGDVYVVWGVPPTLDTVERIGVLGTDFTTVGQIHLNKFIVFITRTSGGEPDEPLSAPILLRGTSRSGRIRSIFDHTDIVGGGS